MNTDLQITDQLSVIEQIESDISKATIEIDSIEEKAPDGVLEDLQSYQKEEIATWKNHIISWSGKLLELRANLSLVIDKMKEQIDDAKQIERQVEAIKGRADGVLLDAVRKTGKMKVGDASVGIRRTKRGVVTDSNAVPKKYKTTKLTESVDMAAAKKAKERGENVPGFEVEINEHLNIC